MTGMRSYLACFLLIAACQNGTATPLASASPLAPSASPVIAQLTQPSPVPMATPALPRGTVAIAGQQVLVDLATTVDSRRQGLSDRASLAPNTGLLMTWTTPTQVSIWMPDMNFPIDVIFIRDGYVLAVYQDEPPCVPGQDCPVFGPTSAVDAVLEVPAGSCARWGVKIGGPVSYTRN
jgi:uncharacterized membrane protein (UPF0127 family)